MRGYVVINESTDPDVTRGRVLMLAAQLARQQTELAAWWQRMPLAVIQADSEAAAPQAEGWTLAKIVDQLDDPDALAYHTTNAQGRPLILMGAQIVRANAPAGADWFGGPDSLATATSHELCETTVNPYVAFWSPYDGSRWLPLEVCDPTQGDSYQQDPESGIWLSNFVGPRYFSVGQGPYDRMGVVAAPRALRPGGYQQILTGGPSGASKDVFGADVGLGGMAPWKRAAKHAVGSRRRKVAEAFRDTFVGAELRTGR